MIKTPFIKRFMTENAFYVYDVNSNQLIRASKILYDLTDEMGTADPGKIIEKLAHTYPKDAIFVNTKGKFYMCERVGANYEIGDMEKGLDFNRIFDFLTAYARFFKGRTCLTPF